MTYISLHSASCIQLLLLFANTVPVHLEIGLYVSTEKQNNCNKSASCDKNLFTESSQTYSKTIISIVNTF